MADSLIADIATAVSAGTGLGALGVSICLLRRTGVIHKLVNSGHTIALQDSRESARRAAKSDPTPENIERADRADKALALHLAQAAPK